MKRLLTHLGLRFFLLFSCIFLSSFFISLSAQEFVKGGANGFEWRLIGRVFFDGGYFFNDTTDLGSSFQVNDIRLGTQIRFLEHWEAKIELGYGDSKISMKDIFLTYKFGEQAVRCGIHMSDPSHFRTMFHALCCRKTSVYVAPTVYAGIFYTKIFHFFHKPICKIKLLLCRWHSLTILITLRIDHHILKQTFICSHNHPHLSLS